MGDFLYTYGKYSELYGMDGNATAKATAFSHWLDGQDYTEEQKSVVKDELAFYNMSPASASKYDKLVGNGVDPDTAYEITQDVAGLEKLEGESEVLDTQKWRECVDRASNPATQISFLYGYMTPAQFKKLETANTFDIDPDMFVGYYEIRERFDENGNGSYSNAEVKAAIDSMTKYRLTTEQKAALWQLMTGAKSAKNNPYSTSEGQRVLDYLSDE